MRSPLAEDGLVPDTPKTASASRSNQGGNLIALAAAQVLQLGSGLAVNVILMRLLGVDGYGVYGDVLTLVGLSAFGATLGMFNLINRALTRAPECTGELVGTVLAAVGGLLLLTASLVAGWAAWMDRRPEVITATGLAATAPALQSLGSIPEAACHAHQRMTLSKPTAPAACPWPLGSTLWPTCS